MKKNALQWIWSAPHNDHYYVTYDGGGNPVYNFAKHQAQTHVPAAQSYAQPYSSQQYAAQQYGPYVDSQSQVQLELSVQGRADSESHGAVADSNVAEMAPPVDFHTRSRLPGLIAGSPRRGWYETLDTSYRVRTGSEAREFFKQGRVFAMLWSEAASELATPRALADANRNSNYTVGRFGESVYSNIRRFVVVQVRRREHFVYACPITTYTGRGTTKPGVNPSEHTIVYFRGTDPASLYKPGEYEAGMTKEPIEIEPSYENETMHPSSRLRFGKTFPIEWNVKVKEIGKVSPHHMQKLIQYWKEENSDEASDDSEGQEATPSRPNYQHSADIPSLSGYQDVARPKAFFKKGRVFRRSGDSRLFVVLQPQSTSCVCLPISTYGGHSAVVPEGSEVPAQYGDKSPMFVILEGPSQLEPSLHINFAEVCDIDYQDVKIQNIGRFTTTSIWQMGQYASEFGHLSS